MSLNEAITRVAEPGTRPWSIAARLAVWYTASAFLLVAVATGLLYWVLITNVDREDDQFLVDTVEILRALIRERPDDLSALRQEIDWEGAARRYARIYARVLNAGERVVVETPGAGPILGRQTLTPAAADAEPGPGVDLASQAGTPYRMLAAWAPLGDGAGDRRLIQVALDRTAEQQLLRGYRSRLWGVLALALVASGFVGYTIARRAMAPITAIADSARRIRSSTLDERIPTAGLPAELSGLADTFNQMLTRLEVAFARLSSLSADLAHELRTPINNLRGEVEVALGRSRTAGEYQEALASVLEESVRLSQMIDGLMFLARSEHPETQIVRTRVDVGRELRAVCEFYEPAAAEAGVTLESTAGTEGLIARFDRTLLQRALGNLITNAITHTPPGGRIRLFASGIDAMFHIDVADTGVGIPPEHLARVSDRFYRVDPSRASASGGLGLGLAIVRSIASVHGGSLQIMSEPGRGTTVRLAFPDALEAAQISPSATQAHVVAS